MLTERLTEAGELLGIPVVDHVVIGRNSYLSMVERGLVWIRFDAPMGWEVVGFLALVTGRLAEAGVPIGAVCSFSRDHLFVAESYLERTREVLGGLFPEA